MGELGPWEYKEDLDEWRADHWDSDVEAQLARNRAEEEKAGKNPDGSPRLALYDNRAWRGPLPVPQTCSFCGCVRYEDLIRLLDAGWWLELSDKPYKAYVYPRKPRYLGAKPGAPMSELLETGWLPTPPVKMYVMQYTQQQVAELNRRLDLQRERMNRDAVS